MKYINKFIAVGLGVAITFMGNCCIYALFTYTDIQSNYINFVYDEPKVELLIENEALIKKHDKEKIIEIPCEQSGKLYEGEEIKLEIIEGSHKNFIESEVYIKDNKVVLKNYDFDLGPIGPAGTKKSLMIKAYIDKADGSGQKTLWMKKFTVKKTWEYTIFAPGRVKIEYVEDIKNLNELDNNVVQPLIESEEVESLKDEIEIPTEPEVIDPPKDEIETPTEPEVIDPPKDEIETPTGSEVIDPPKDEIEVPTEPEIIEPPKEEIEDSIESEEVEVPKKKLVNTYIGEVNE